MKIWISICLLFFVGCKQEDSLPTLADLTRHTCEKMVECDPILAEDYLGDLTCAEGAAEEPDNCEYIPEAAMDCIESVNDTPCETFFDEINTLLLGDASSSALAACGYPLFQCE